MNKQNIFIIISIIGIFIFAYAVMISVSTLSSNVQENNMCENWLAALNQKKADYENMNFLEKLGVDTDSMNADVNAYNQQCAYQ
jgi:flagellar basal body-associated protein FliL